MKQNLFAPPDDPELRQALSDLPDHMLPLDNFVHHLQALDISSINLNPVPSWFGSLSASINMFKQQTGLWFTDIRPGFLKQRWEIIIYSGFFELTSLEIEGAINLTPPSREGVLLGCNVLKKIVNSINNKTHHLVGEFHALQLTCENTVNYMGRSLPEIEQSEQSVRQQINRLSDSIRRTQARIQQLQDRLGLGSSGGYVPEEQRELRHLESRLSEEQNERVAKQYDLSNLQHLRQQLMQVRTTGDDSLQNSLVQLADFWGIVLTKLENEYDNVRSMVNDVNNDEWKYLREDITLNLNVARRDWWSLVRAMDA